ncbi:hypothetical protein PSm6_04750 [Pseudomonas solani]|uniref:Aspartyl/asparaginy/proline hydroxylase domain-containing protein n=1 Tax=Pseudomonas solani TaxID=2731552 RepID=A0ABM7L3H3_9PSED|nr:hypothetical protein PSm6_04750 [Pseudomonas solani]
MDVTLPICSRLPWRFDLEPLLAALERIDPTAWVAHFNTAYYQGDWSGIDLVAAVDAPIPLAPGFGPVARSALCAADPAWQAAIEWFGEGLRSARLLRLGAGASIREHCDPDLGSPEGPLRLHMPLLSPPGVEFLVDGRQVPMAPGECWFIDLSRPIGWTTRGRDHASTWCWTAWPTRACARRSPRAWRRRLRCNRAGAYGPSPRSTSRCSSARNWPVRCNGSPTPPTSAVRR